MERYQWYTAASQQLATDINNHYLPGIMPLLQEMDVQGGDTLVAQTALSAAPQPLTAAVHLERTPYQSADSVLTRLSGAAERGVLETVTDKTFRLTEKGEKIAHAVPAAAVTAAQAVQWLSLDDAENLAHLLRRMVDASLSAAEPAHPNLNRSRFYDPGPDAPALERLRRYLNDLNAFRDDAHIAAWQAYDLAGYEWEAFSHVHGEYVFGDPVATAAALAEKLSSFRGYDAAAYEGALQKVAERGWLEAENGRYTVTAEGRQVRDAVEMETDRLFFAPWNLTDGEVSEMKSLMSALHDTLKPPELKDVWRLLSDTQQVIAQRYWPTLQKKAEEVGFAVSDLMLTRRAAQMPGGVSPGYVQAVIPYMKPETVAERLAGTAARGFTTGSLPDGYTATERGQAAVAAVMGAAASTLTGLTPLPLSALERLVGVLQKLCQGLATAEQPEAKPALSDSRHFRPDDEAPVLWRINGCLIEVINFRDDAHVAAWQPYGLPGYQWEAFSHVWGQNVWGDPVATATAVAEKLAFRGYDASEYTAALQDCCQRGLLMEKDNTYTVTEKGQQLRQEAEMATDDLFFAPWSALYVPELIELYRLLGELYTALQASND